MADQHNDWARAGEVLGGISAFAWASWQSIRTYLKARNTNHSERIARLERQRIEDERTMARIKVELEELTDRMDIALASNIRRILNVETNLRDTEREIRDSLQSIVETLNRRLHGDAPVPWKEAPPPASR